jgi:outer membrane lipopolysaccharide assembly protein LptE/RlpB
LKGVDLRRIIYYLALAVSCILLGGCGYHLTSEAQTTSLLAGKTIAIPMWRSKIYRPNLEAMLTGSLIDEFALRSGGMVVAEDAAELLLTGTIVTYATVPMSFTAADQVKEYRATMTVEATLAEKRSQKVLWKGILSASQDYKAINDPALQNRIALQQNSEDAALREIDRKIAQQLFQKMWENF